MAGLREIQAIEESPGLDEPGGQVAVGGIGGVQQELGLGEVALEGLTLEPRDQALYPRKDDGHAGAHRDDQDERDQRDGGRAAESLVPPRELAGAFAQAGLGGVFHRQVVEEASQVLCQVAGAGVSARGRTPGTCSRRRRGSRGPGDIAPSETGAGDGPRSSAG